MTVPSVRVALFARFPIAGRVKTRLSPTIDAEAAAALHARLVERTLATMRASGLPFEVHITGAGAARFRSWLGDDVPLVEQGDGDLGDRMARVVPPAIIIGADIPDLRTDHLRAAAAAVAAGQIAIGPAEDGGYYLIGLPQRAAFLFDEMPWGTDRVLAETLARLGEQAIAPVLLPMLADLDRPEDLDRWPQLTASRSPFALIGAPPLPSAKFADPARTATGAPRAQVGLATLKTLWLNTGTLCNLACAHCYIESSPTNDRLAYLTLADATRFFDEIAARQLPTSEIGLTGGEPFMNPDIIRMIEEALGRGFKILVLTNAMKPMRRHEAALQRLAATYGDRLTLRVGLDHPTEIVHDAERGRGSWQAALDGLCWLAGNGVAVTVAGRHPPGTSEDDLRDAYRALFAAHGLALDVDDPSALVLFPEMDATADIAEITTDCWAVLGKDPGDLMCATSRMVIRRKGDAQARVVACTLLPDDPRFDLGATLAEASAPVALNHPHCARFCVLGGASCSGG